jgi:hypothetical protein
MADEKERCEEGNNGLGTGGGGGGGLDLDADVDVSEAVGSLGGVRQAPTQKGRRSAAGWCVT